MSVEITVAVTKVDGGFIVQTPAGTQVVTSLNKAVKVVRETLGDEAEPAAE